MEHQAKSAAEQAPARGHAAEPAARRADDAHHDSDKRKLARALDRNPRIVAQTKLAEAMDNSPRVTALRALSEAMNSRGPAQRKGAGERERSESTGESFAPKNETGLPDQLKSGVEALSGVSLDDVRVHYNSSQPARMNALAYAQGNDIHVAPGQERHLPHEAWHVVQQAQGRVKPTLQMKGVAINDDSGLEREADVMGAKAEAVSPSRQFQSWSTPLRADGYGAPSGPIQRLMKKLNIDKEQYTKLMRSTVVLYAEYESKPLGVFQTTTGKHAEENLIDYIKRQKLAKGKLEIYLSATPCSNTFCTREDGEKGCMERLEELNKEGFKIKVTADHLYQPQATGQGESGAGFGKGFSSFSAAATSSVPTAVSKLPKMFSDEKSMLDTGLDGPVAQLRPGPAPAHRST
ncbi:MAG: hypothetical protein QOF14_590 [Hyphomicrobiales bacterium]|jgi:hypothetical protein|nr:hypothetical protein [Hyphomicrobiales bacterium]